MSLRAAICLKVGDHVKIIVTDYDKHGLCCFGRTATVVGFIRRANGKITHYLLDFHCSSTIGKEQYGSHQPIYVPKAVKKNLRVFVGMKAKIPQSYVVAL